MKEKKKKRSWILLKSFYQSDKEQSWIFIQMKFKINFQGFILISKGIFII